MFIYGKTAANAIAVVSYLAADPKRRAGSAEISHARGISKALTAKLLTQLAAAGIVSGQPGPGGGYMLAKPVEEICLFDVVALFEQTTPTSVCPFGKGWCGNNDPCPLHDSITRMTEANKAFMEQTKLDIFLGQFAEKKASGKTR